MGTQGGNHSTLSLTPKAGRFRVVGVRHSFTSIGRAVPRLLGAGLALCLVAFPAGTQTSRESKPVPRWPDGRVNLGAPPGEAGFWEGSGRLTVNPNAYDADRGFQPAPVHIDDVPLQPWARALLEYRHLNDLKDEPYTRCKPSPGPRFFATAYGLEMLDSPDQGRIYIFVIGGPHTYRTIYMDGRSHPDDLAPTYLGHSIGRWDGDTLVIDTVGFNERAWMDRYALPHTDRLHLVERVTRVDFDTLEYEVTIDDPGAYTAPWTTGFSKSWSAGEEMFEYVCQDNNYATQLMIGLADEAYRDSRITP